MFYHVTSQSRRPAKWSAPFSQINVITMLGRTKKPPHDKTNKMTVRPEKTQISLGIRPVGSESSLSAQWVAKVLSFLQADSEDSDETARMPRLI